MSQLPHLAARIFNKPLMIEPTRFGTMLSVIGPRLGLDPDQVASMLQGLGTGQPALDAARARMDSAEFKLPRNGWGYELLGGISVIDISGALTARHTAHLNSSTSFRSYESIRADVAGAADDPSVKGILLRMDTPGGEGAGIFDLADAIAEVARVKPVWAVTDEEAFSAGYAIASQATRVLVSQTGGLGSVGVIAKHFDWSAYEKNLGVKVTLIYSGERKADFSPHKPLSSEAEQVLTNLVLDHKAHFAAKVAAGRDMSIKQVLDTESGLYFGQDAIDVGFADAMLDYPAALAEMQQMAQKGSQKTFDFAATAAQPEQSGADQSTEVDMNEEKKAPGAEAKSPPVDAGTQDAARKAGYADAMEIAELCTIAGKPEMAAEFITKQMSAAEVKEKLINARAAASEREAKEVDNSGTPLTGTKSHPSLKESMRSLLKTRGIVPSDERGKN